MFIEQGRSSYRPKPQRGDTHQRFRIASAAPLTPTPPIVSRLWGSVFGLMGQEVGVGEDTLD